MKNRKFIVLVGLVMVALVFATALYADGLKTGRFAYPGTDLILKFFSNGLLEGISNKNPNVVQANGRYSISGTRLTMTFNSSASGDWAAVAGKTFVYTIDDEETFSGNGEQWVRIGD